MINIVAKREENGVITCLKSEYGNIFTREVIIETINKGYNYYTISKNGMLDQIYTIFTENGIFLSINKNLSLERQKKLADEIGDLPTF